MIFVQFNIAQDMQIDDEQAYLQLMSTDSDNGALLHLDNFTEYVPFAPVHVVGALNFANTSGVLGQIGYTHGGLLGAHKLNFHIQGNDIMTLFQTPSLAANSLEMSNGAVCTSGGIWTDNCSAKLKNLNHKIHGAAMLDKISQLPIYAWNYKSNPSESHIGPTAEDFNTVFNLEAHPDKLAAIDLGGVSLAAIQELHAQLNRQSSTIIMLEEKVRILEQQRPRKKRN